VVEEHIEVTILNGSEANFAWSFPIYILSDFPRTLSA